MTSNELYATAAQDLSDRLQLFFEGRFAERDALESGLPATETCRFRHPTPIT